MVYRAIRICSSYQLMHAEFEFILNLGLNNGYPLRFIHSQIRKTLNRHFETSKKKNTTAMKPENKKINDYYNKEQIFIDLPYFGNMTNTLGKKITKLAKDTRPGLHVQPIYRPPPALTTYFSQKDKLKKDSQSNVVYMISCSECDENYIGKTIRQASRRHYEHGAPQQPKVSSITLTNELKPNTQQLRRSDRNKNRPKIQYLNSEQNRKDKTQNLKLERLKRSALFKHQLETNHQINWKEWKIIFKDEKKYRLLVRESLQILLKKPTLNRTVVSVPLIVFPEGIQIYKPRVKIKTMAE